MSNIKQPNKKASTVQKSNTKTIILGVVVVALLIVGFFAFKLTSAGEPETAGSGSGDLTILKSEITETAKFYPYKVGKTNMEVLAVKASDGSVRTAFNTCQVCFDSGKGYYVQQGKELVCQNCGNRFKLDQIEKIKGGCNPVPIVKEEKTDDGTNIVIPQAFMVENKSLFGNWRK